MSSFAGYCGWCRKPVMHKTFFGTLHLCLSDEEKSAELANIQQKNSNSEYLKFLAQVNGASKPVSQDEHKNL